MEFLFMKNGFIKLTKKCAMCWLLMGILLIAGFVNLYADDKVLDTGSIAGTNGTLITSKSLVFDQKKGEAVFEGNVVVQDPDIKINSDKLVVLFTQEHKITKIEAIGGVVITREDIKANSKKAEFEVETGKIVLSGSPRVKRGEDTLTGDTIIFWRDDNRIVCEPNASLFIRSNQKSFKLKDSLKR